MTNKEIEDTLYLMKEGWTDQHKFDVITMQRLGLLTAAVDSLKKSNVSMAAEITWLKAQVHAIEAHLFMLESMGTFKDKEE